jgi:hypothetical protein
MNVLCRLLQKKSRYWIYVYIDSPDVVFEQKVFNKNVSQRDAKSIVNRYAYENDSVIGGFTKIDDKYSTTNKSNATQSSAERKKQAKEQKKNKKQKYIVFQLSKSFANEGIKQFMDTVSNGTNKIRIVNYLPLNLINSPLTNKNNAVITVNIKIDSDGAFSISASQGLSFLVSRDDKVPPSEDWATYTANAIDATMRYIETIVTELKVAFQVNIIGGIEYCNKLKLAKFRCDKLNIITDTSILQSMKKVIFRRSSTNHIDDILVAFVYYGKFHHQNWSNKLLDKKFLFFKAIPITRAFLVVLCLGLFVSEINDIFVNNPQLDMRYKELQRKIVISQGKLLQFSNTPIDNATLDKLDIIFAVQDIEEQKIRQTEIFTAVHRALNAANVPPVESYVFTCKANCQNHQKAQYSIETQISILNSSGYYEDMVKKYSQTSEILTKELSHNKMIVSITPFDDINQITQRYFSKDVKIIISSK